ncbi:MAG: hypothetical protein HC840_31910 [Leptolyngbyaceae cyanobacterium RM2_2_4]|nr:hypothetical protein [bacterium]NJO53250.1 hypothetical protein [Leptolyngbyaceae cyanobacterium RM2_2_4]
MKFELLAKLLDTERQFQTMSRRIGIMDALDACFKSSARPEQDAIENAKAEHQLKRAVADLYATDDLEPVKQTLANWATLKFDRKSESV